MTLSQTLNLLLSSLLVLACGAPPVFSGSDRRQNASFGLISGSVVATTQARGNVVVFLFDADRPPPPQGTGRPVAFSVVSREVLFGSSSGQNSGPFVAPYSFSLVPPGRYLIRAFVDASTTFIPWYSVTSEPKAGDVGGGAIDIVSRQPRIIEVGADATQRVSAAVDIPVLLSDDLKVPVDRPTFEVSPAALSVNLGLTAKTLELKVRPLNESLVIQPKPVFLVRYIDDNQDGMPDDANADGQPDLWPKVAVRKIAEGDNPLADENDLDRNGLVDATGVDYEHVSKSGQPIAPDGKPDVVILAASFDVTDIASQLVDATGKVKAAPTPVSTLKLSVLPRAFDLSNPKDPQLIRGLPRGRYAVTVIQSSGQTWRLPNELGPPVNEALGLSSVPSQAFVLVVP